MSTLKAKMSEQSISVYWWNFRRKTLDFNGSVKDYFERERIKISSRKDKSGNTKIKVRFSVGSLNDISFTTYNLENAVKMCLNIRLTYLGDKAQFSYRHRTFTINY